MKHASAICVAACLAAVGGCGAQDVLLGTDSSYLFTAADVLARPGEEVDLTARLRAGDFLQGQPGCVVRFRRDGELYRAAETGANGTAVVAFTPPKPGDYVFTADVAPVGLAEAPPRPLTLRVACRAADAPMVVVDMDKTLVASGFHSVLIGDPEPMRGSVDVIRRLARTHTIVYLTHRPDYFGPKSKAWLVEQKYPPGPVLLSSIGGFLKGSGAFKTEMLRGLRTRFTRIEIGIGDKVSDAAAYHDNGMKAFLIIQVNEAADPAALEQQAASIATLPEPVHVVTEWSQIERALFEGAAFPVSAAVRKLKDLAAARKKQATPAKDEMPAP